MAKQSLEDIGINLGNVVNVDALEASGDKTVEFIKEARNYASKLAQLRRIDSVELYRIDKTEIFA